MAKDNQPDNKTHDPLMKPVQEYLEKRAAEDPQFAEKFNNPKKSLKECCKYIYGEAKKRAGGSSCVYIPQEEVFGWAVHYYDEDDIKVSGSGYTGSATVAAAPAVKPVELTAEQKAKAEKAALEKYEAEQRAKIEAREKARRKAEAEKKKAAREEAERRRREEGEFNLFNLMGL
jgi:hypothetical protein